MKRTVLTPALSATVLLLAMQAAHAGPQAHVVCSYSHTLGDDAIMMYGMPNEAMLHDFFGNVQTDAYSSRESLRTQEKTTCDNKADSSAYWAPSLKLPDGTVVKPAYQKTYYQASNVDAWPLHPFRRGCRCWRAIITAPRQIHISPFYAPTARATPPERVKSAAYARRRMPCSLISAFSSRTAGTGST